MISQLGGQDKWGCRERVRVGALVLWSPGGAEVEGWMVDEGEEGSTVDADDIDVGVLGRVVGEGEVEAVWGPGGIDVFGGVVGELHEA
jgi:hypothetical protein